MIQLIDALENWGAESKQVIDDTFMGDAEFYKESLKLFASENSIQQLREALVPEKQEEAIRIVHTMKGNSDYLGLFPITDAAVSVLIDLRNNQLEQGIADMAELEKNFAEFKTIIG